MCADVYNKYILPDFTEHQILSKSSITQLKCANMPSETHSYRFNQVVVRNLGKQMMNHVSSNVMMDVVDPTKISVNCGQTSLHVFPFLFQRNNTNICETVRNNIELQHPQWANNKCKGSQSRQHSYPTCCWCGNKFCLIGYKQITLRIVMRSWLPRTPWPLQWDTYRYQQTQRQHVIITIYQ